MDNKIAIREFLKSLLIRKGDNLPFGDESPLLTSGRLQSVDAVEIAVYLEEQFGVDFAEIGFDLERIEGVDAIAALIEEAKTSA
jgi:acyl carrier protein